MRADASEDGEGVNGWQRALCMRVCTNSLLQSETRVRYSDIIGVEAKRLVRHAVTAFGPTVQSGCLRQGSKKDCKHGCHTYVSLCVLWCVCAYA